MSEKLKKNINKEGSPIEIIIENKTEDFEKSVDYGEKAKDLIELDKNRNNFQQILSTRKWDYLDENKKKVNQKKLIKIKNEINQKSKKQIKEEIESYNINNKIGNYSQYYSYKIGGACNINIFTRTKYLNESNYNKNFDESNLEDIYKYRSIFRDGNCFFRAVCFK